MTNTEYLANIAREKAAIFEQIKILLDRLSKLDEIQSQTSIQNASSNEECSKPKIPIMLTIKECVNEIDGLKEFTLRQLVAQNKVKYFRTGNRQKSRILVNKDSVIEYLSVVNGDYLTSK